MSPPAICPAFSPACPATCSTTSRSVARFHAASLRPRVSRWPRSCARTTVNVPSSPTSHATRVTSPLKIRTWLRSAVVTAQIRSGAPMPMPVSVSSRWKGSRNRRSAAAGRPAAVSTSASWSRSAHSAGSGRSVATTGASAKGRVVMPTPAAP